MNILSYQEDQIALALARFNPRQQLFFAIGLCTRLLSLYAITSDPAVLTACLERLKKLVRDGDAQEGDLENLQIQLRSAPTSAQVPWTRECIHAFQLLVDAAGAHEHRLAAVLEIVSSSREIVELVAWENLQLAAWDKNADEKIRHHPLVQSELEELYEDLKNIWNSDNTTV